MGKRMIVSAPLFLICVGLLMWTLFDSKGFSQIWQYFAWGDQLTVAFAFASMTIYLMRRKCFFYHTLIPGGWYAFIAMSSIIGSAKIGFGQLAGVDEHSLWICAYVFGGLTGGFFIAVIYWWGKHSSKKSDVFIEDTQETIIEKQGTFVEPLVTI
jgi:carbon starvation protein CstA